MVIKGIETTNIQVPSDWMEGFNGAAADFVDAILKGRQPMMDIAFSKQVLQVTLAAYEASDSGKQVSPSAMK
jgi:predicted dehydrogenase